jgi:hypothetical protein
VASKLQFLLDLDAKYGPVKAMRGVLASIEKTLLKLDPNLKRTGKAFYAIGYSAGMAIRGVRALGIELARVGRAAPKLLGDGLGHAGGKVKDFFRDAASSFLGFASFEGLKALSIGAVRFTGKMIETAGQAQETGFMLDRVFGPKRAADIAKVTSNIAKATGIDDDPFNRMAISLGRVGFNADLLPKAFAIAADIATAGGGNAEAKAAGIERVSEALERMFKKEGFSFKTLGAVDLKEADFFAALGERMGKSAAEAQAIAEKGKGDLETIFHQIVDSVGKSSKGAPGGMSMAVGQMPHMALARAGRTQEELMKALAGSPAMDKMGAALTRFADVLDPETPTGKKIIEGFERMVTALAGTLGKLDVEKLSLTLVDLFTKLPPLIAASTYALEKFARAVSVLLPNMPASAAPVALPPAIAKDFAEREGNPIQRWMKRTFGPSPEKLKQLMEAEGMSQGKAAGRGLGWGVLEATPGVAGAASTMVERGIKEPVTDGLETHSPSRVMAHYGRMADAGFVRGLDDGAGDIERAASRVFDLPAPSRQLGAGGGRPGGGGGGMTVTVPITVNYAGQGGAAGAREMAATLEAILPGHLQAAFERMRLELGMG